jgi:farnesyl-diphosphate farnesyltransferase
MMSMPPEADRVLKETSRTFYLPTVALPQGLREAVTSFLLCLRAADSIEDHPRLPARLKQQLLRELSDALEDGSAAVGPVAGLRQMSAELPEVTMRIHDWARIAPPAIAYRVWDAAASLAERMAQWVGRDWLIGTESDLDRYTFCVAGSVGLLLCDLWAWHDGTISDRSDAVAFGKGLQAVNILQNRADDLACGRDYFPREWTESDVRGYATRNLGRGKAYVQGLPRGPALEFCQVPLALAWATLHALEEGRTRLSRPEVSGIVGRIRAGRAGPPP